MTKEKNLAAVALGSIKTEKKAASSRENGKKGGTVAVPIDTVPCTCGHENAPVEQHLFRCKRRMRWYYRERYARQRSNQGNTQN